MSGLAAAAGLLTRVPMGARSHGSSSAVPWFGVVGALVGAVVGATAAGMSELVPATPAAAVAVLVGLVITGALHEDGLADSADALVGGWTREQRFQILDDPHHGTYGVAALCGSIVLRVAALATLAPAAALAGAVAAHSLARATAGLALGTMPPARADGLGAHHARSATPRHALVGVIVATALAALTIGWWAAPALAAALVGGGLVAAWGRHRLGGVTGDVLGAVEQVAEWSVLLVVAGLAPRHGLWWR